MNTYVLYHRDQDGQGAALAAYLKLGNTPEYISVQYGEEIPELNINSTVYIVDFSYKKDVIHELLAEQKKVVILDHHKTAQEELKFTPDEVVRDNLEIVFDMNKCGAWLSWEYFHPNTMVPEFIKMLDDYDRWQFKIDGTKELHAFLDMNGFSLDGWKELITRFQVPEDKTNILTMGSYLLKAQDQAVEFMSKNAKLATWHIHIDDKPETVVVANTGPYLRSQVGNLLLEKYPSAKFSVIYWDTPNDTRVYSLRSRGDYDVSDICRTFHGGGHPSAAGFEISDIIDFVTVEEE